MDYLTQWLIDNGLPPPPEQSSEPSSTLVPDLGPSQGGPGSFPAYPNYFAPYVNSPFSAAPMIAQFNPISGTPNQNEAFAGGGAPSNPQNLPAYTDYQPGGPPLASDIPGLNAQSFTDPNQPGLSPPLTSDIPGLNAQATVAPEELAPPAGAGDLVPPPGGDVLPAQPADQGAPQDQPPLQNVPQPGFTPPGQPGLYAGGAPNQNMFGALLSSIFQGLGNFFSGNPTPGIAPGGSPVGSFTPDPVASGIPLPGNNLGLGSGGGGNLGGSGFQNALFHNVWGGKQPLSRSVWGAGAGTDQSWASMPGGTYQNYLNLWQNLRSQPGTSLAGGPGAGSGGGPGGAGRPAASPT